MTTVPSLKDLCEHVTPKYAVYWRMIGILLGLSSGLLDIIEYDNMCKAVDCCNAMFSQWLGLYTNATWKRLFSAIESPLVYKARALKKGTQFIHVIKFNYIPCCVNQYHHLEMLLLQ